MTTEEKQEMKEYIFQGIQAGQKTSSGLVSELKDKFLGAIRSEIQLAVNGKIDGIKVHLENQDSMLNGIKNEQTKVREDLSKTQTSLNVSQVQFWTAVTILIFLGGTIIYLGKSVLYNDIDLKIKDDMNSILNIK